jgi:CYTH domain-containing protein
VTARAAVPLEIERRFVVTVTPDLSHPSLAGAEQLEIKQTYLVRTDPSWKERVRRVRREDGSELYFHTAKRRLSTLVQEEDERQISRKEYTSLSRLADPERCPVRKRRYKFEHDGRIWELDFFREPESLVLLEVELADEAERPVSPPFLDVTEVSGDGRFSSRAIAKQLRAA